MANRQKQHSGPFIITVSIALVIVVASSITFFSYNGKSNKTISKEAAQSQISSMMKHISLSKREHDSIAVEMTDILSVEDELPDINTEYPIVEQGRGSVNVEIWTSPEKGGKDTDGFLVEMAKKYNAGNNELSDGRTSSVTLRSISSGTGVEYITAGKAVPQAFTPSNDLWGKMIEAQGIKVSTLSDKIVGNTAGILVKESTFDMLEKEYAGATFQSVYYATTDGNLKMGYTNPYSSSTGLNFLIEALYNSDKEDMLGSKSVDMFQKFQSNVPLVAYTTQQMVTAADKGTLEGTVTEYQSYANDSTMQRNYQFIPFGYPHNNPMYAIGILTDEQQEVLNQFVSLCDENQSLATRYGFNGPVTTTDEMPDIDGSVIAQAQSIWKESKDNGVPIVCEFVMDISGSMDGEPINNLRTALLNSMNYIGDNNYIGLVSFNDSVYDDVDIGKYDLAHQAAFKGALQDMSAGGGTAMFDGIVVAMDKIQKQMDTVGEDVKPMIIVLTDGESNSGYSIGEVKESIAGMGIPVYTISYNGGSSALNEVAAINEAANMACTSDDVVYKLKNLFNAQL